jgi:predicted nuclease of predicted toxin-antitoxin system
VIVWIDAQLPPALVQFFKEALNCDALSIAGIGLREATDAEIYYLARQEDAIVLTKDRDFLELSIRLGPPPRVILLRCGNTSNLVLRRLLLARWADVVTGIESGDSVIEISDEGG